MSADHDILGVSESATRSEIRSAYRALALKHHPDRGGDATAFARVVAAYNRLLMVAPDKARCDRCDGRGYIERGTALSALRYVCAQCGGSGHD